ncbi:MAG: hypothetical protein ABH885_02090, partial [Candidatus Omnitrophota bacterium]
MFRAVAVVVIFTVIFQNIAWANLDCRSNHNVSTLQAPSGFVDFGGDVPDGHGVIFRTSAIGEYIVRQTDGDGFEDFRRKIIYRPFKDKDLFVVFDFNGKRREGIGGERQAWCIPCVITDSIDAKAPGKVWPYELVVYAENGNRHVLVRRPGEAVAFEAKTETAVASAQDVAAQEVGGEDDRASVAESLAGAFTEFRECLADILTVNSAHELILRTAALVTVFSILFGPPPAWAIAAILVLLVSRIIQPELMPVFADYYPYLRERGILPDISSRPFVWSKKGRHGGKGQHPKGGGGQASQVPQPGQQPAQPLSKIDINKATHEEIVQRLEAALNITKQAAKRMAARISERIAGEGPFGALAELANIQGIGGGSISRLDKYFYCAGASRAAIQAFNEKYEIRRIEKPEEQELVVGIGGYVAQEECRQIVYNMTERYIHDAIQAIREGRSSIFKPSIPPDLSQELMEAVYNIGKHVPDLAYKIYRSLPVEHSSFFVGYIHGQLKDVRPEAADWFVRFFNARSEREAKDIYTASGAYNTESNSLKGTLHLFLVYAFIYECSNVVTVKDFMARYRPFMNAEGGLPFLISATVLPLMDGAEMIDGKQRPWLKTGEAHAFIDMLVDISGRVFFRSLDQGNWPRDSRSRITARGDYVILDRHERADTIDLTKQALSGSRDYASVASSLAEEGALIQGRARTDFLIISKDVPEAECGALAQWYADKGMDVKIYRFTPGFITLTGAGGRLYRQEFSHLDTVINFIDGEFTNDGIPRLLIDPCYHEGVKNDPDFMRFLEDQKDAFKLEIIEERDIALNLANFTMTYDKEGRKVLVFNGGSATVKKLNLKEGRYRECAPPIMYMASCKSGVGRCLTQHYPAQELEGDRHVEWYVDGFDDFDSILLYIYARMSPEMTAFRHILPRYLMKDINIHASDNPDVNP